MAASEATIHAVIETYHRAAAAARGSALREGNLVQLGPDDADEVMITADLHGNRRNYERIVAVAALDDHPRRHLVMQEVCHGGPSYPCGTGCMSHLMLEDVAALQVKYGQRFHFLLSNHELAELTDFPIMKAKRLLNLLFRCGLQEMYGDAADRVREAAMDFVRASPLAVRIGRGVIACHSLPASADKQGFDAGVLTREWTEADVSEGGDVFRLLWGRDYSQATADAFAAAVDADLFITGHEPCELGYQSPNTHQVIIDCCSDPACYVLLPVDAAPQSRDELLGCVRYLHNGQPVAASAGV